MSDILPTTYAKLRSVIDASQHLTQMVDEHELFETIATNVCRDLGFSMCVIFVLEGTTSFVPKVIKGYDDDFTPPPSNYVLPMEAFKKIEEHASRIGNLFWVDGRSDLIRHPIIFPHVVATKTTNPDIGEWHEKSLLIAPLRDPSGKVVGLVNPDDPIDGHLPSLESTLILETYANFCSIALELIRARTNAAAKILILEAQRSQIVRLFEASNAIRREAQLDEMLEDFARSMSQVGDFQRIGILLIEEDKKTLRFQAGCGFAASEKAQLSATNIDISLFSKLMQPAMLQSRSYVFDHTRFNVPKELMDRLNVPLHTQEVEAGHWHPLDSLSIPMQDESGRLIGIISADEPLSGLFPEPSHLEALEFFADQCAIAVSQVQKYKSLERRAEIDSLTGLPNRATFTIALNDEIIKASQAGEELSLLFMDLDHFKAINDSFGHLGGDRVLKNVASLIRNQIRKTDFISRYGGEEFTVLLPQTKIDEAVQIAEKIRQQIENNTTKIDALVSIKATISIGASSIRPGNTRSHHLIEEQTTTLISRADKALYAAKACGRNQVSTDYL